MKKFNFLGITGLLLIGTAVLAFTSKPEVHKKAITEWFTISPGADPHVPLNYTDNGTTDPGFSNGSKVAAIEIDPASEKYPSGSGVKTGKPIVDVSGTSLYVAIDNALSTQTKVPNRVELVTP